VQLFYPAKLRLVKSAIQDALVLDAFASMK